MRNIKQLCMKFSSVQFQYNLLVSYYFGLFFAYYFELVLQRETHIIAKNL